MDFIENIQYSGKLAIDLVLYLMLPITVVMGGLMKVFENKGVLVWLSIKISRITNSFGASGLSLVAAIKMLFVSSIAPFPSLAKLEILEPDPRKLAASIALVLTMTQGNASFPLIAYGINIWVLLASSIIGGVIASWITYYLLMRNVFIPDCQIEPLETSQPVKKSIIQSLSEGGAEGMKIAINMLPMLVITLFILTLLKDFQVISVISEWLAPVFAILGLPGAAVIPIITKYIAGGTAYLGVIIEQVEQGALSVKDLNIIAGLASNPVDLVGLALFSAIGPRIGRIFRYALVGACVGLLVRAVIHIVWFS